MISATGLVALCGLGYAGARDVFIPPGTRFFLGKGFDLQAILTSRTDEYVIATGIPVSGDLQRALNWGFLKFLSKNSSLGSSSDHHMRQLFSALRSGIHGGDLNFVFRSLPLHTMTVEIPSKYLAMTSLATNGRSGSFTRRGFSKGVDEIEISLDVLSARYLLVNQDVLSDRYLLTRGQIPIAALSEPDFQKWLVRQVVRAAIEEGSNYSRTLKDAAFLANQGLGETTAQFASAMVALQNNRAALMRRLYLRELAPCGVSSQTALGVALRELKRYHPLQYPVGATTVEQNRKMLFEMFSERASKNRD